MKPGSYYTYDTLEPGQPLPAVVHEIDAAMHRDYCSSTGEQNRLFLEPDGADAPLILPPAVANILSTHVLGLPGVSRPSGDIHAGQVYEFVRPIQVGDVITTSGFLAEKFERRGRKYVVIDTHSLNQDGFLVARCRVTFAIPE